MSQAPVTIQNDIIDLFTRYEKESLSKFEQARLLDLINKFIIIDKSRGLGYKATYYYLYGYVKQAEEAFKTAIRLNPFNDELPANYAIFLFSNGEWEEATKQALKAIDLNCHHLPFVCQMIHLFHCTKNIEQLTKFTELYKKLTGLDFDFSEIEKDKEATSKEDSELDLYTASLSALRDWESPEEKEAWDK